MRIDIGGLKLFVDVDGFELVPNGEQLVRRPVILLVHGGPGFDHTPQKRFAPWLAEFAQIVCYDQRGHGRSDHGTPETWNLDHWADDIVRLCDALGIEKPIVLGSSFGGIVTQAYAIKYPNHPSKLILHSTTPHFSLQRIARKFECLGGAAARDIATALWRDPGDPELFEPYRRVCMPLYNVNSRNSTQMDQLAISTPSVLTHFYSFDGEGHRFDFRKRLAHIECPVLVMAGTEDPICPIEDAEEIVDGLPPGVCTFKRFDDCGHGVHWDDPEGFVAAVRDFVYR